MIDSITLYFREGSSDKVYQAGIETAAGGGYNVTFAYGRRGAAMNTGRKASGVALAEARTIYDRLVREKTAKGYTPGADGTPYGGVAPAGQTTGTSRLLPQLLNVVDEAALETLIASPDWWMQEKHDGRRLMVVADGSGNYGHNKLGGAVALSSPIDRAVEALGVPCILDGEDVGDTFHVFDALEIGGRDLRGLPYASRYQALGDLIGLHQAPLHPPLQLVGTHDQPGRKRLFLGALRGRNAEGVVFKDPGAAYTPGRPNSGGAQLKFKFVATASCIVTGKGRKQSVALGLWDDSNPPALHDVGNVTIPPNRPVPEPGAVVEVRYLYAYRRGSLFQPVYLGERDDTTPAECLVTQLKYKPEPQ